VAVEVDVARGHGTRHVAVDVDVEADAELSGCSQHHSCAVHEHVRKRRPNNIARGNKQTMVCNVTRTSQSRVRLSSR
jgi:hypothetical protein